ncbi:IclR family transcriptional regulator [Oryzifoliimicrobium ureilyticus]|uniref:IclR family transcriptional regulator n=1 Tax=Oryzifoliimicrobium ureilyticus TaxID=3113724 RepID=UPI003075FE69
MTDEENDRYRAPALDKGLDILELLASVDGGLTQADIARGLGKSPNEFYRMLDRLVRRGYVARQEGDRFCLTLKLFALSHYHAPLRRLTSFATPIMRDFANLARQACHLAVFDRGAVVVISQQDSPTYWGLSIRTGAQMSLFNTGSGHVLLAFRSNEERQMMIEERQRIQEDVIVPADLQQKLTGVVERGFEAMESAQTRGVLNLSAPILSADGSAIAALTCPYIAPVGPIETNVDQIIDYLKQAASRISRVVQGKTPD